MRRSSAVALLTISIVACAPGPTGTVPPTNAPTASPPGSTPTSAVAASPAATSSPAPATWTATYDSELTELNDVVEAPHGFIAAGCTTDASGNCLRALLLTSPDGTEWTAVDLKGSADTQIWGLKWVRDRLFAIGLRIDNQAFEVVPVVWTSVDGQSWSRSSSASTAGLAINDVIDSPVGALAVGIHAPYSSEGSGFVVWNVGDDGSFGEPTDVHPRDAIFVAGAAWTGDRFLAWGPGGALGEVMSTVVLTSRGGTTWKVRPETAAFRGSYVYRIAAIGDRIIAVGTTGGSSPASPRAWTSADGATWDAADVPADPGAMITIEVEGTRLVARGTEPVGNVDRPVTWTSSDGKAWTRLPPGEEMPDLAGFAALHRAVVGGRACVAGTFSGDPREPKPRASIYCR